MIYLEYDDGLNRPRIRSYENEEAVLADLCRYHPEDREFCHMQLLDDDENNDDFTGEYNNGDRWTLITEKEALERAEYWTTVAHAIRNGQKAP